MAASPSRTATTNSSLPLGRPVVVRQRAWQAEPGQDAVLEAGQGADPAAVEGEDVETDPVADAIGGAQVGAERRLAVGPRRNEVEPAARAEDGGAEAGHDLRPLVLEGHRRPRQQTRG